jgi:hypothetical protein
MQPWIDLGCHPQTPCDAVRSIRVGVARTLQGLLTVNYAIEGELERVRIPAPRAPARRERLWQHTCCEIFVARAGRPSYDEFNFSPSGEWAAYVFERYREGRAFEAHDPKISVRRSSRSLELGASVPVPTGTLSVGLATVIEGCDGMLSYWALRHPPGRPDFHHAEAFALELD